jgi:5-methylcytosine-specific restriction endonuclease McrA
MMRAFSWRQRQFLRIICGNMCSKCGSPLGNDFHADHVIAWSKGGPTLTKNGQALCPTCNLKKGATCD